jgi:hypothetical protein
VLEPTTAPAAPAAPPAATTPEPYQAAPAPPRVDYPEELQQGAYLKRPPAPTPQAPTATLDPFYAGQSDPGAPAPQASAAPPPNSGQVVTDAELLNHAFEQLQALYFITDRTQALTYAMDTVLRLIPSEAGAVLIYDAAAGDLQSEVTRGPGEREIPPFRVGLGTGLAGFCAKEGLPLALSQVSHDDRFSSVLSQQFGLTVRCMAGAPIQYQGRLFGVLEIVNRRAGETFTANEINTLAYVARQLAERLATAFSPQG